MKKIYMIAACFLPLCAVAQTQGKVTYEERIKIDLKLDLDGMANAEEIRAMLPKSQTVKKELLFTPEATLYRTLEKNDETIAPVDDNGGQVQVRMIVSRPEEQVYRDLGTGKIVEKKDLFGRSFIIKRDDEAKSWKLTDEQKEILGYMCKKAVAKDSASVTEAWYAPAIPVPAGPWLFGQLPGLVLEVNVNDGKTVFVATEVKLGAPDVKIAPPDKGKQVTQEEFKKIAEEKAKEMEESMGGKGNIIIRRSAH